LKSIYTTAVLFFVLSIPVKLLAQHHSKLSVEVNLVSKTLTIQQEITFYNESEDTLTSIVLNDWNAAFSDKNTPLGKRFSDEFYRGFHLAKEEERGGTKNLTIIGADHFFLPWERTVKNPDYIVVTLQEKLAPKAKTNLYLTYTAKIPTDKFTKFGYTDKGGMSLKDWFITPARYENHAFKKYNNTNLDDIANGVSDFDIELKVAKYLEITSDLNTVEKIENDSFSVYKLKGNNRTDFIY
jgi:hypothetical protein